MATQQQIQVAIASAMQKVVQSVAAKAKSEWGQNMVNLFEQSQYVDKNTGGIDALPVNTPGYTQSKIEAGWDARSGIRTGQMLDNLEKGIVVTQRQLGQGSFEIELEFDPSIVEAVVPHAYYYIGNNPVDSKITREQQGEFTSPPKSLKKFITDEVSKAAPSAIRQALAAIGESPRSAGISVNTEPTINIEGIA